MAHSRAKFHLGEMPGPSIIKKDSSVVQKYLPLFGRYLSFFHNFFHKELFCFKKVVDDPPFGFLDNIIPPNVLANLIFSKALD
jgi:hypothetical protein